MKGDEAWDLFIGIINAWEVGYGTSLVARYFTPRPATQGFIADTLLRAIPTLPTDMINYEIMPFLQPRPPILPPSYESVSSMASALTMFNAPIINRPMFYDVGDGVVLTDAMRKQFKVDDWATENRMRFLSFGSMKVTLKCVASILPSIILRAGGTALNDYALICMVRYMNDLATMYAISYTIT